MGDFLFYRQEWSTLHNGSSHPTPSQPATHANAFNKCTLLESLVKLLCCLLWQLVAATIFRITLFGIVTRTSTPLIICRVPVRLIGRLVEVGLVPKNRADGHITVERLHEGLRPPSKGLKIIKVGCLVWVHTFIGLILVIFICCLLFGGGNTYYHNGKLLSYAESRESPMTACQSELLVRIPTKVFRGQAQTSPLR